MTQDKQQTPAPVSLGEAFWYWLKLGFVSFGGPTGQIAMMREKLTQLFGSAPAGAAMRGLAVLRAVSASIAALTAVLQVPLGSRISLSPNTALVLLTSMPLPIPARRIARFANSSAAIRTLRLAFKLMLHAPRVEIEVTRSC